MPDAPKRDCRAVVILSDDVTYNKVRDYELPEGWAVKRCGGFYTAAVAVLAADLCVLVVKAALVLPDGLLEVVNGHNVALVRSSVDFGLTDIEAAIERLTGRQLWDDFDKPLKDKDLEPEKSSDDSGESAAAGINMFIPTEPQPVKPKTAALRGPGAPVRRQSQQRLFADAPKPGELLSREEIQALLGRRDEDNLQ